MQDYNDYILGHARKLQGMIAQAWEHRDQYADQQSLARVVDKIDDVVQTLESLS